MDLWEFWRDIDLSLAATLARKRYIDPGQDALVPGEEADNESSLYATFTRSLGPRVNGSFRVGWQKVETNFQRRLLQPLRRGLLPAREARGVGSYSEPPVFRTVPSSADSPQAAMAATSRSRS